MDQAAGTSRPKDLSDQHDCTGRHQESCRQRYHWIKYNDTREGDRNDLMQRESETEYRDHTEKCRHDTRTHDAWTE